MIGPAVCADRDRVTAVVVGTIDRQAANARLAHLGEGDLGWASVGEHALLKRSVRRRATLADRSRGERIRAPAGRGEAT